jgi:hypothetical protein
MKNVSTSASEPLNLSDLLKRQHRQCQEQISTQTLKALLPHVPASRVQKVHEVISGLLPVLRCERSVAMIKSQQYDHIDMESTKRRKHCGTHCGNLLAPTMCSYMQLIALASSRATPHPLRPSRGEWSWPVRIASCFVHPYCLS